MKMSLIVSLLALCFSSTAFLEAFEVPVQDARKNGESHGIGIGGTVYETWGFSYRHHFSNRFGISTNLGGGFWNDSGHAGLAIGGMYTFAHHNFPNSGLPRSSIRIYAVAYAAGVYHLNSTHRFVKDMMVDNSTHSAMLGLGIGPGAEYFFTENFSIHLEIPWMTKVSIKPKKGLAFENSYPNFGGGWTYFF